MNDMLTDLDDFDDLDDFERDVVRTLRAKADQIAVADSPFHPDASPAEAVPIVAPRQRRRRALALAAAVAVLVGGVAVVQRLGSAGDTGDTAGGTFAAGVSYMTRADGVAGFLPARLPEGWTLQDLNAGSNLVARSEATWQLFGEDGPSSPSRGALVGSAANVEERVIDDPTRTIHGEPASIGPSPEPHAPAGALHASWIEGDVVHDAIAVGMTEGELVAFLESLASHEDPATGFSAPADTGLPEIDATTVGDQYTASATYAGPAGDSDTVRVTAKSPDYYGGLLHRLVGEPSAGGRAISGATGGDQDYPFVSLAREDGWTLEVMSDRSQSVAQDPAVLDALLDSMEPVTTARLVEIGLAEPVTATGTVGGWTIEVHGTDSAEVAMCVTPEAGETVCTTAEDWPTGLTTGSALVGGQWILTAVSDGMVTPTVRPAPNGDRDGPEDLSQDPLPGERGRSGDQVIDVFTIPAGVDTVGVMVPTVGEEAMGRTYDRPPG